MIASSDVGENVRSGWIIAVDYDSYLAIFICREDSNAGTYDSMICSSP